MGEKHNKLFQLSGVSSRYVRFFPYIDTDGYQVVYNDISQVFVM